MFDERTMLAVALIAFGIGCGGGVGDEAVGAPGAPAIRLVPAGNEESETTGASDAGTPTVTHSLPPEPAPPPPGAEGADEDCPATPPAQGASCTSTAFLCGYGADCGVTFATCFDGAWKVTVPPACEGT